MKAWRLLLLLALPLFAKEPVALPEPGPEAGGLRLRLIAAPRDGREGFDVRVDVINVTASPITLRGEWRNDIEDGDLKNYLDVATSIECVPEVRPWMGGVEAGHRTKAQPEQVIDAGATLTAMWQTEGRHLKNRVLNPNEVQNPEFPTPGLYSVHARVKIITGDATVLLRSNEQLLPVGGSRAMPKPTYGALVDCDPERKTATIGLGSLQQVAVGDRFEYFAKMEQGSVTITKVSPDYSTGTLEMKHLFEGKRPVRGTRVSLVLPKSGEGSSGDEKRK